MGSVVISLDAELGWGVHHEHPLPASRIRNARSAWKALLRLFDEYEIPATWAVVGHLFLEDCDAGHTDHPAGSECCLEAPDGIPRGDTWFANGLIEEIVDADVDHELASHGFSHVHFAHERMNPSMAESECAAAAETLAPHSSEPRSFVFPVNEVGFRDRLSEHGFACYRGPAPDRPGPAEKLWDGLRGRNAPPIVEPTVDEHGMVNVPASLYLFSFEGVVRKIVEGVRDDPIVTAVRLGIDALQETDGVLHLWLHPHNVLGEHDRRRMERVLAVIDTARRRSDVTVETMASVARRVGDGGRVVEESLV